ncbi:WD40-repeat-containing domain protein [Lanmaoa asiatica]|nr:WD40-repeat-containing domain protein [Lanmaoa asiatica]
MTEIDRSSFICSVAFLADGKHIVGGGYEGKVRRWRTEDGQEVGPPMNAGDAILSLVVSRDGWIVSATESGRVTVWDAETHSQVNKFQVHADFAIETMDVSPDGTRIATGSHDSTVCVWSLSTGERLLGPLHHGSTLAGVKYSFDGRLLATAICEIHSIRIYDSQDGRVFITIPVKVDSFDQSLVWSANSKHLFVLSDGNIKCLDVSTGATLSVWPIHSSNDPRGITLASNGRFIAASANSSVSFWDTTTHEQVGPIIEHADVLFSMAISRNYDLVTSGVKSTVIQSLHDTLPSRYCEDTPCEREISCIPEESTDLAETIKLLLTDIRDLRAQHESSHSNENGPSSSSVVHQQEAKPIEINCPNNIYSVAFLDDGKYVVGGGDERKIRRWRVEDGKEVGTAMDAGGLVCNIAVSQDGKWIVGGMISGSVTVWNAESYKKVDEFKAHKTRVCAVDISPDATKIATGSEGKTACVWSFSTQHERLFGPWKHDYSVAATKFSPDGRFVATATWNCQSIRIYDSQSGQRLIDVPVQVNSAFNQSLAWASDSTYLFALSHDGSINCLDVSTGTLGPRRPIHSSTYPGCITLTSDGRFIAVSGDSSVSFWDAATHKQLGQVIRDNRFVEFMKISPNVLVTGGGKTITLRNLCNILPSRGDVSALHQKLTCVLTP